MAKPWLYCLDQPFEYEHPLLADIEFQDEWVTISNSKMLVNHRYAWDGCSPKVHVFGLFAVGTPDGCLRHGKPWLYHESLVHDVLCQFRHELPLSKENSVAIWNDLLTESGWPLRPLYVVMVDRFGPQDWAA